MRSFFKTSDEYFSQQRKAEIDDESRSLSLQCGFNHEYNLIQHASLMFVKYVHVKTNQSKTLRWIDIDVKI